MSVLTKLMDAQMNAPATPELKKKARRRKKEDPVSQMKKIQKIEKKVKLEEKRAKIQAKLQASLKKEAEDNINDYGEDTLPGKKLPIWKKRSNQPFQPESPPKQARPQDVKPFSGPPPGAILQPVSGPPPGAILQPVSGPPPGARLVPVSAPPQGFQMAKRSPITPSPRSYKRTSPGFDRPKVPRQIREIQENLSFEKIRRTGSKNLTSGSGNAEEEPTKEMSVEEMKEFMEEQRKRLQQMGEEDDDYFDNDAGFDDFAEEEEPATITPDPTPAKPILKTEKPDPLPDLPSPPRKSVRFSLKSGAAGGNIGAVPTPKDIDQSQDSSQTSTPPKKRGRPSKADKAGKAEVDVDNTLDEFNKAVEELEAQEENISRYV